MTLFSGGSGFLDVLQALNICFPAECEEGGGGGDRRAELSLRGQGRIWATPTTGGGGDPMGARGHFLQTEDIYLTRKNTSSGRCTARPRNACQKLRGKVNSAGLFKETQNLYLCSDAPELRQNLSKRDF